MLGPDVQIAVKDVRFVNCHPDYFQSSSTGTTGIHLISKDTFVRIVFIVTIFRTRLLSVAIVSVDHVDFVVFGQSCLVILRRDCATGTRITLTTLTGRFSQGWITLLALVLDQN